MSETPEGMGGRKFSLERVEGQVPFSGMVMLKDGAVVLAYLTPEGMKLRHLLATAPQLWEAANGLLLDGEVNWQTEQLKRLGDLVAKAVGKDNWLKVLQS